MDEFSPRGKLTLLRAVERLEMLRHDTVCTSVVFHAAAKPHQGKAAEPHLYVHYVLQLLQELQGLRFLLQVLRGPATTTTH